MFISALVMPTNSGNQNEILSGHNERADDVAKYFSGRYKNNPDSYVAPEYNNGEDVMRHGKWGVHGDGMQMSIPIIRQVIIIEKQPSLVDMIPKIVIIAIYAFIIQTIFMVWRNINKKSHDICIFLMLLFFPPVFLLYFRFYLLPICWLGFFGLMLFNVSKVLGRGNFRDKDAMKSVYAIFRALFIVSNSGIFLGQLLTFVFFYMKTTYLKYSISLLLFFLYFGLLSREMIFFLNEVMVENTGFYSKDGVPGRVDDNTLCMICAKTFCKAENIHVLACGHSFHEDCIKGWCLLGKRNFCPYCRKKVESSSLPAELWHKTEVWFFPLINTLRSFIVFKMVLVAIILYKTEPN